MIKIVNNKDLIRDGERIGKITTEGHILNEDGEKLGYVHENDIYSREGKKIATVGDEYVHDKRSNTSFHVGELDKHISGGEQSHATKGAIRIFFGD